MLNKITKNFDAFVNFIAKHPKLAGEILIGTGIFAGFLIVENTGLRVEIEDLKEENQVIKFNAGFKEGYFNGLREILQFKISNKK